MISLELKQKFAKRNSSELPVNLEVFESYWKQCDGKLSKGSSSDLSDVVVYVGLIEKLLQDENFIIRTESGQVVHYLFENAIKLNLFQKMYEWHEYAEGFQLDILKSLYIQFYDALISSPCLRLFLHRQFLLPMMSSLYVCSRRSSVQTESLLLQTLHAICVALHQQAQSNVDNSILGTQSNDLFWSICLNPASFLQNSSDKLQSVKENTSPTRDRPSSDTSKLPFTSAPSLPFVKTSTSTVSDSPTRDKVESLCNLLVPYVHRDGSLSWISRDALLLLATSSCGDSTASYNITKHSSLCEVLMTDMALLFNNLPRRLASDNAPESWPHLLQGLESCNQKDGALSRFLDHYEFCCSILDVSNFLVKKAMLECMYRGFLIPVLAPALMQTLNPELATVTMYLEAFLLQSKGGTLLPFLLHFLLSEQALDSSELWLWNGGSDLLHQSFTQALEQSFPGTVTSYGFFDRQSSSGYLGNQSQNHHRSYLDVLIQRVYSCDTLVGIATLSLLNTILGFVCEDVTFELVLKYLVPLGEQSSLKKMVSDPSAFVVSANQFLSLIPPYSSIHQTPERQEIVNKKLNAVNQSNMDKMIEQIDAEEQIKTVPLLHCYLEESQQLVKERYMACVHWRFAYDFTTPTLNQVYGAHLNQDVLALLPQDGLQIDSKSNIEPLNTEHQWELDEKLSQMCLPATSKENTNTDDPDSSSLILAQLDRFSALLRQPSTVIAKGHAAKKQVLQLTRKSRSRRIYRSRKAKAEEIKRTSSLYDISFTDLDIDEPDEDSNECEKNIYRDHSFASERCNTGAQSDTSQMVSSTSATSLVHSEPSVATCNEASPMHLEEQLFLKVTDLSEQFSVSAGSLDRNRVLNNFIKCLDKMPTFSVDDAFEANLLERLDRKEIEQKLETNVSSNTNRCSDSGFGSIDQRQSGIGQPTCQSGSGSSISPSASIVSRNRHKSLEKAPGFPGPFLSAILQLISRMPLNHFYVNLLATEIMSKLVAHPLPLLRILLLTQTLQSDRLSPREEATSCQLYAILLTVRQWFDCYINFHFPQNKSIQDGVGTHKWSTFSALSATARSEIIDLAWSHSSFGAGKKNRTGGTNANSVTLPRASFFDRFRKTSLTEAKSVLVRRFNSDWRKQATDRFSEPLTENLFNQIKDEKLRGVVISCLVFEEFCQELAALCLEHSVNM